MDKVKRMADMALMAVDDLDMVADKLDRAHMVKVLTGKVKVVVAVSDELENTTMDTNYDSLVDGDKTAETKGW